MANQERLDPQWQPIQQSRNTRALFAVHSGYHDTDLSKLPVGIESRESLGLLDNLQQSIGSGALQTTVSLELLALYCEPWRKGWA